MKNISEILGIYISRTCAYRPSINGCVERVHRTINSIFAKTVNEDQRNWCEMAPYVAFAYNTAYHSSTTFSPFYLLYLREPRLPIDLALENVGEVMPANPIDYVEHVALRMKTGHRIVQESLDCTFGRAKQRYDARVKLLKFKIGDLVWYFCPRRRPCLSPQWQLLATSPWRVIKTVNLVNVVIQKVNGQKNWWPTWIGCEDIWVKKNLGKPVL